MSIADVLSQPWWQGVNALAIIITLIVVIIYTWATSKMTSATKSMAEAQRETILFQKRPVITIICADPSDPRFPFTIINNSKVHAKALIQTRVMLNQVDLLPLTDDLYDGKIVWPIQAKMNVNAHLNLINRINRNGYSIWPGCNLDVRITLNSWAINFFDPECDLKDKKAKNPEIQWYWDGSSHKWVLEESPN